LTTLVTVDVQSTTHLAVLPVYQSGAITHLRHNAREAARRAGPSATRHTQRRYLQATYLAFSGEILREVVVVEGFVNRREHGEFLVDRDIVQRALRNPQQVADVGRRCIYRARKLAANRQRTVLLSNASAQ